jgi:hypothetical protein
LSSEGFAESSVVVVEMKEEGVADVEHHRSAACGIWELGPGDGVEGERGMPPASSSAGDLSSRIPSCDGRLAMGASDPALLTVGVVWPFRVVLESGLSGSTAWENEAAAPLALLLPLVMMSALSLRLLRVGCAFIIVLDVLPAIAVAVVTPSGWVDAADSWSVLLPTFILESVDLRFDNGARRAYSCADGMGGGKKGDPGDGKGDEDDSLLIATVSGGVSEGGVKWKVEYGDNLWAHLLSQDW